jgi:hypothetical protein
MPIFYIQGLFGRLTSNPLHATRLKLVVRPRQQFFKKEPPPPRPSIFNAVTFYPTAEAIFREKGDFM